MANKNSPVQWAIKISKLLKSLEEIHGIPRIPVNVIDIAKEYSKQICPSEPITSIDGEEFSNNFDGLLVPKLNNSHGSKEWGIFYNNTISCRGRVNFTLAHEFGHYLLHRTSNPEGLHCNFNDMLNWKSREHQQEQEANIFASYLLMPLDDFRKQLSKKEISLDLFHNLAEHYCVSITAVILKWLSFTEKRAMIVVGKEEFIDWAWSSENLLKSGIFYRARQDTIELPKRSLAVRRTDSTEITHPIGVWPGNDEVYEMVIHSQKNEFTVSLLLYPDKYIYEEKDNEDFDELSF